MQSTREIRGEHKISKWGAWKEKNNCLYEDWAVILIWKWNEVRLSELNSARHVDELGKWRSAPSIINLDIRHMWVVSFKYRSFYPPRISLLVGGDIFGGCIRSCIT